MIKSKRLWASAGLATSTDETATPTQTGNNTFLEIETMNKKTEATFDFYATFEFCRLNDRLEIQAVTDEAWVSDNTGCEWELLLSLPQQRGKTGWETAEGELLTGEVENSDCESMMAQLQLAEQRFDEQLRDELQEWLEDKHVTQNCPRGFTNEVDYTVHNGISDDDCSADLIDYLMSYYQHDMCSVILDDDVTAPKA